MPRLEKMIRQMKSENSAFRKLFRIKNLRSKTVNDAETAIIDAKRSKVGGYTISPWKLANYLVRTLRWRSSKVGKPAPIKCWRMADITAAQVWHKQSNASLSYIVSKLWANMRMIGKPLLVQEMLGVRKSQRRMFWVLIDTFYVLPTRCVFCLQAARSS